MIENRDFKVLTVFSLLVNVHVNNWIETFSKHTCIHRYLNQTQVKREEIFKKIGFNWPFWYIKVFNGRELYKSKKRFWINLNEYNFIVLLIILTNIEGRPDRQAGHSSSLKYCARITRNVVTFLELSTQFYQYTY